MPDLYMRYVLKFVERLLTTNLQEAGVDEYVLRSVNRLHGANDARE